MHINKANQILARRPAHLLFLYHVPNAPDQLFTIPSFNLVYLCLCHKVLSKLIVLVDIISTQVAIGQCTLNSQPQTKDITLFGIM